MKDILRPIYQERASQQNTLSVLYIEKRTEEDTATNLFDAILFTVVKEQEQPVYVKHYRYEDKKAALYVVSEAQLKDWLLSGSNSKMIEWITEGVILFDRNEYMVQLKNDVRDFPFDERKMKIGTEFAKLIRRYLVGKDFFNHQQYLDAYSHIIHALHHLARLAVIENGIHPETTVWNQVKQVDLQIFKLYEELVTSRESLQKRLELLFLASEFLIHSRTPLGARHLLELMEQKEEWTIDELLNHPSLQPYHIDLTVLLEFLLDKNFIEEVIVPTKGPEIYHRHYRAAKKY
ncbi:nucleotidyltransferase-like protein [Heyndrickxia acidiproducens]|uniref:nucleotidyltransferase-like protein n=1 Tax=Heyndrickxia acidiproducens TaxID=1121084 RepID=UPI0003662B4E|nr:nucleotidyltransferase-like protein [Heyndrickxia acidiproducens]